MKHQRRAAISLVPDLQSRYLGLKSQAIANESHLSGQSLEQVFKSSVKSWSKHSGVMQDTHFKGSVVGRSISRLVLSQHIPLIDFF